jgi:hypothetical protein
MTQVLAYHPETKASVVVGEEALEHHMRLGGWMKQSEWEAQQAAAAAAAEAPAKDSGDAAKKEK